MPSSSPEEIAKRAASAYRDATAGDFRGSQQCLSELGDASDATAKAWSLALLAQRWHAEPSQGSLPIRETLRTFLGEAPEARTGAVFAAAEGAKVAILAQQGDELAAWVELLQELGADLEDLDVSIWTTMNQAWLSLSRGAFDKASELAQEAQKLATGAGIASGVIESIVLRSLCAEAGDDLAEATSLARQSSRMARTEDLPQWQYLASLVLARMRRLNGLPHLTERIIQPLVRVAPPPWHAWIAWEGLMAGAIALFENVALDGVNDPTREVQLFRELLQAATQGQAPAFVDARDALSSAGVSWELRKHDLAAALAVVDASSNPGHGGEDVASWCRGEVMIPPARIAGLCIDVQTDPSDPGPAAFVVTYRQEGTEARKSRRVAGIGEPIVEADARIARARGAPERTPTALAAISLAGTRGIARVDLFRTVYGFEFDADLHGGLFRSLLHRVRRDLGDWGEVHLLDDDRYLLEPACTLVIPDPRCEHSLEDVVLRVVARRGAQSAKQAAGESGLPLRSTQRALKMLVENGALVVERVANDVTYRVEDTTFSEPTKWS